MELNEVLKRVLGQHRLLIGAITLLPVLAVLLVDRGGTPAYTATTRMVLDTADPRSSPESVAIADTAKAIATSRAEVGAAISDAGVRDRHADIVARHAVDVRGLGTSGVLELSVTDSAPGVAAAIANALTARVIETRVRLTNGRAQGRLATMDRQIQEDTKRISRLDAEANDLLVQASAAAPRVSERLRARRDAALRERDLVTQRRFARDSERATLLATLTARPEASILSEATTPLEPNPSGLVANVVLAGLLGVIMGVGVAGLLETLRPTLVGRDAVAAELAAPLLAHIDDLAGTTSAQPAQLANRLRMSAEAAHVRSLTLLPTHDGADFRALVSALRVILDQPPQPAADAHARGAPPQWARGPATTRPAPVTPALQLPVYVFGIDVETTRNSGTTGLAVVAPATVKKDELADTRHLLRVSPAPMLGVITYDGSPSRRELRPRPHVRGGPTRV